MKKKIESNGNITGAKRFVIFRKILLPVLISFAVGTSCKKPKSTCTSIPATVSFSANILPVFSASCSTSGCHSGTSPSGNLNLEVASAYTNLMSAGKGYVNTSSPTSSVLYSKMNSNMPPSGKLDDCKIQTILKWIQQGAKNN